MQEVLDDLPVDQPFDWVQNVSIELTARMLATLLDFRTSSVASSSTGQISRRRWSKPTAGPSDNDEVFPGMRDMARGLSALWHDKAARMAAGEEPGFDLITMLQSNENTKDLIDRPMEFLGNLVLLIVGGNGDPQLDERRCSCAEPLPPSVREAEGKPDLIPNMGSRSSVANPAGLYAPGRQGRHHSERAVHPQGRQSSDVVRLRATATSVFERPDEFIIDRANARNHISFGFGVHRCMGNRLAELQLRILWEELLPRFDNIEVVGEPEYVQSNFVRASAR